MQEPKHRFTVGASTPKKDDPSFDSLADAAYAYAREHMAKGRRRFLRKLENHPKFDGFKVVWRLTCQGPNTPFVMYAPKGLSFPTESDIDIINGALQESLEII